jgi:hypothetical protein
MTIATANRDRSPKRLAKWNEPLTLVLAFRREWLPPKVRKDKKNYPKEDEPAPQLDETPYYCMIGEHILMLI